MIRRIALVLALMVSSLPAISQTASGNATVLMSDISPPFISSAGRLWVVSHSGVSNYAVLFSDDNGTSWSSYVALPPLGMLPGSIFVHPSGNIYIAESSASCKNARVIRVDPLKNVSTAQYLDPGATVLPWGWSMDSQGNLYAGEYGWSASSDPSCGQQRNVNISCVYKVADSSGAPTGADKTT